MKKLSVSSLVEYLHASPSRRAAIIKNAIDPQIYYMDRYGVTLRAASTALTHRDATGFEVALSAVNRKTAKNQHHAQRLKNTKESLTLAKAATEEILKRPSNFLKLSKISSTFELGGLTIKVSPQAISIHQSETGNRLVGLVKYHCGKTNKIDPEQASDFATLLQWFSEEKLAMIGQTDPKQCLLIDIFENRTTTAPQKYKMRRKRIMAACEEICDRWDAIQARSEQTTASAKTRVRTH